MGDDLNLRWCFSAPAEPAPAACNRSNRSSSPGADASYAHEPVEFLGQYGLYTDLETQVGNDAMVLNQDSFYDPIIGRYGDAEELYGDIPIDMEVECEQYRKVMMILAYEKEYGTVATANHFSNTFQSSDANPQSDMLGWAFDDDSGYHGGVQTVWGCMDLDWYTDLRACNATKNNVGLIYEVGKAIHRKSVFHAYEDNKEAIAVGAIVNGAYHYSDLFPQDFMFSWSNDLHGKIQKARMRKQPFTKPDSGYPCPPNRRDGRDRPRLWRLF